jgi:hypothetical protein
MAKRFGLVAGGTVSALSFLVVDLARKDAVFSVSFSEIDPDYPNSVVFDLMNFSNQTMTNAHIRFALYDAKGALIRGRNLDGNWGSIDDSYFTPLGMTIGANAGKDGPILFSDLERPVAEVAQVYVCALFDGTFWIDTVRTEYRLTRERLGYFGQADHATSVHFFTTPDCLPPETLADTD